MPIDGTDGYRLPAAAPHSPSFVKPQKAAAEQIRLIRGMCLVVGFAASSAAAAPRGLTPLRRGKPSLRSGPRLVASLLAPSPISYGQQKKLHLCQQHKQVFYKLLLSAMSHMLRVLQNITALYLVILPKCDIKNLLYLPKIAV